MDIHICFLLGIYSQTSIPPAANTDNITHFEKHFLDTTQLKMSVQAAFLNYGTHINEARNNVIEANSKLAKVNTRIAKNLSGLRELHKEFIFQCIAAAGLERFSPDIMGSFESMYNLVHKQIGVHTFRAIAAQGGYDFMECNIAMTKQIGLVTQMYRNFLFSRLKMIVATELKKPGRVVQAAEANSASKQRTEVR